MSTGCKYNQVNSHFHCIREGCQFSFLLKHQMTSHARKHMRRMLGKNFDRVPPSQVGAPFPHVPEPPRERVCPTLCPPLAPGGSCSDPHLSPGRPQSAGHGDRRVHGLHGLQPRRRVLRVVHHGPQLLQHARGQREHGGR